MAKNMLSNKWKIPLIFLFFNPSLTTKLLQILIPNIVICVFVFLSDPHPTSFHPNISQT